MVVIVAICLIAVICFLAAGPIDRLLGNTGKIVFTRLLGVLLAALAVQFVADGVLAFVG
jgi:multiple antibiotic resistance protein